MKQEELQELQTNITEVSAFVKNIKTEMGRILSGQQKLVDRLLLAMISDGHVLLEGVPGLAKTLAVKTLAQTLDGEFSRIQFTPDLLPADVVGTNIYNPQEHTFSIKKGPVFANLILADEINRAPAKVQSALLECMQERQATIAGTTYKMPTPFLVLATQNPIEQEGTYPLPEAQQDRFMLCLYLDYPSQKEELEIMVRTTARQTAECRQVIEQNEIIRFQQIVQGIGVPEEQISFAVSLIRATRPDSPEAKAAGVSEFIDWGAGPRAGQALIKGAKAIAAMDGRPAVAPEDILHLVIPVLRHRIACNYKARAEGITETEIIRRIVGKVRR